MSNLLEKASILLTPTATSAAQIHCIKPNTFTGDFNFTRSRCYTNQTIIIKQAVFVHSVYHKIAVVASVKKAFKILQEDVKRLLMKN